LYHNDGAGHFQDVTASVGLAVPMYGMGVAVGDWDNDGFDDLAITALGGVYLFHNEKGRRFRPLQGSSPSGTAAPTKSGLTPSLPHSLIPSLPPSLPG